MAAVFVTITVDDIGDIDSILIISFQKIQYYWSALFQVTTD
jgi:hypothetical protein